MITLRTRPRLVKRPSWRTSNGPTALKKVGLNIPQVRKENQRIADHLIKQGFEFVEDYRVAEFSDFGGYTLSFRKTVDSKTMIHFSWQWCDVGTSIYWYGKMRTALNLNPGVRTLHPYLFVEVDDITARSLHLTNQYETFIRRSLNVNVPWVDLVSLPVEVD